MSNIPPSDAQNSAPHPYAAQPTGYALPAGYPAGAPQTAGAARNLPGILSLVTGLVLVLWQFVFVFVQAQAVMGDTSLLTVVSFVNSGVQLVLSIASLVLGIIGLQSRSPARVAAGIGTGLGIAGVAGVAVGLLYPLVFQLLA